MKKILPILVMLGLLANNIPAAAKTKERVGEPFRLLAGIPTIFPEGEPFHIAHGWVQIPSDSDAVGKWDFELEVDSVPRREDFVQRTVVSGDPDLLNRVWVSNFPEGMMGTHTFTGHWLGPCQELVDGGVIPGPCEKPNEKVEALTRSLTVTFTP